MFHRPAPGEPRLAHVLGALSHVLDLTAGRAPGHALRACWVGMWIGRALGVRDEELYDLYYGLLLRDAGRDGVEEQEVHEPPGLLARVGQLFGVGSGDDRRADERARERGRRGAELARRLGFGAGVADALAGLDERWNGRGRPDRRAGRAIPRAAQVSQLAAEIDLLYAQGDRVAAEEGVRGRRGSWFDPELVAVFDVVTLNPEMWNGLRAGDLQERVRSCEPPVFVVTLTDERLDRIAEAFGAVLDNAVPYGEGRAARLGELAVEVGRELGLASERLRWLRRSAQLFDARELGEGDDDPGERVDPFRELARAAGQGFPRASEGSEVALELRIAAVAAEYDARTAERPDHAPLDATQALAELDRLSGTHLDPNCLDALRRVLGQPAPARAA